MPVATIFTPNHSSLKNREKFIIFKIFHILLFSVEILFVTYYRNDILYCDDFIGTIADYYKLIITFVTCSAIIVEPLINLRRYKEIEKIKISFNQILDTEFSNLASSAIIKKKILDELLKVCIFFTFFFMVCEFKYFTVAMQSTQARNIYFVFTLSSILMYCKVAFIFHDLIIFKYYIQEIRKICLDTLKNFECSEKLKSYHYDKILLNKFQNVVKLYQHLQKMICIFNESAYGLLAIFLGMKLYLMGDFYWIALVTMHTQIKMLMTYSKY